jgi:hypothetical protein
MKLKPVFLFVIVGIGIEGLAVSPLFTRGIFVRASIVRLSAAGLPTPACLFLGVLAVTELALVVWIWHGNLLPVIFCSFSMKKAAMKICEINR